MYLDLRTIRSPPPVLVSLLGFPIKTIQNKKSKLFEPLKIRLQQNAGGRRKQALGITQRPPWLHLMVRVIKCRGSHLIQSPLALASSGAIFLLLSRQYAPAKLALATPPFSAITKQQPRYSTFSVVIKQQVCCVSL